jgi:acetate---CoA ligase (ADP-forming)
MPDLNALLAPRTIAIVGASPNVEIIRGELQHVLCARGFPGRVYPISRSHAEVQGLRAYPSVTALPEKVDLALIVVPAASVPDALEDCGKAGIRAAYVISSGFAEEPSNTGPALQQAVCHVARKYDMAVCGPNAEGFFNAPARVVATFSPAVQEYGQSLLPETTKARRIAVVAQSGGIGFAYFHRGRPRQLRFDYLISTGNEAALESFAIVEHLLDRDAADIFLMYLEGVRDVSSFRRAACKAADRGKPLIVAKMGRSEVARRAVFSHTAALAGTDSACDAVFRRHGVIRADDMDTMLDIAAGLSFCPLPKGRRVAVMSSSGGAAVWMAELLAAQGLEVPRLDPDTRAQIDRLIPSYGTSANPVDLTAQALREVGYSRVVEILQRSPVIDAVVVVASLANPRILDKETQTLAKVASDPEKPVLFCAYTLPAPQTVEVAAMAGVPVYSSMQNCARALRAMAEYAHFQQRWVRRAHHGAQGRSAEAWQRLREAERVLCEYEAKDLLATYDVPRPAEELTATPDAAAAAASRIGFPVALKIQSPEITHKTEIGGVALDLQSEDDVRTAFRVILARARSAQPTACIRGVLVQKMAPRGREVIVGIHRDQDFGPILMVGLGGVYVEAMRDVAFAPVPLSHEDALDLLQQLRGIRLLQGVRGELAADIPALADLMVRVGQFAADFADDIEELDLNPVLVHPSGEGLTIVDALIVRRSNAEATRPTPHAAPVVQRAHGVFG